MATIDFVDGTPAAPSGKSNVAWQKDGSGNVSGNLIPGCAGVLLKTTSYTVTLADGEKLVSMSDASPNTVTLPSAAPFAGWFVAVQNVGAGTMTLDPNGLNLDGAGSTIALTTGQGVIVYSSGSNYYTMRGAATGGGGGSDILGTAKFDVVTGAIANARYTGDVSGATRSSAGVFAIALTGSPTDYVVTVSVQNNSAANFIILQGVGSSGFNVVILNSIASATVDPDSVYVSVIKQ